MGQMATEQTVAIIDAVRETVEVAQPEPTGKWWALLLVLLPVILTWVLSKKKDKEA